MATSISPGQRERKVIARLCTSGLSSRDLLSRVAARVREYVPGAHHAWFLTDPATMLFTGMILVEDQTSRRITGSLRLGFFENEFVVPDYAKFADILRGPRPVVTLTGMTGGHPERSVRYRTLHRPHGLIGELRAVFATGGACWAVACFARDEEDGDFTREEVDFVGSLCEPIAQGLRLSLLMQAARSTPVEDAPGVVVLDTDNTVESMTDSAAALLAELPCERPRSDPYELPSAFYSVAMRARSRKLDGQSRVPQARIRTPSGRWLILHGSPVSGRIEHGDKVAVIVEPATPPKIAPIVVALYELTPREQQITLLLVRGRSIDEIAQSLWISRYTVRDHVKSIFAKLDVSSRPELTAKLFVDHFLPGLDVVNGATDDAQRSGPRP